MENKAAQPQNMQSQGNAQPPGNMKPQGTRLGGSDRHALNSELERALTSPIPEVAQFAHDVKNHLRGRRINFIYTTVSVIAIFATTVLTASGSMSPWIPFILMFLLVFVSWALPSMRTQPAVPDFASIENLLTQECDPYRFARAYSDLMPLFQYAQDKVVCKINVALGLFHQGAYDAMESYLASIDPYSIPETALQGFYDLQAHYFLHTHDLNAIQIVENNLKGFSRAHPYDFIATSCSQTLDLIEAHRLSWSGDESGAFDKLDSRNRSISESKRQATPYQLVDYHFQRAAVAEAVGDYSSMMQDCLYVIDNGGLLAYVQEASDMLGRH
jgi:hypothetical protein